MTIHLPEDLERYLHSQVRGGKFTSEEEAIFEALRLLRDAQTRAGSGPGGPLREEELERQMVQSGFLAGIPSPAAAASACRDFQPISIQGEPLSETIVRERR